jgi:hypothetical protein
VEEKERKGRAVATKKFRLKDEHPVVRNVDRVFELMDELGLSFEITRMGEIRVRTAAGDVFAISDAESTDETVSELPPALEWKVTFEKDVPS